MENSRSQLNTVYLFTFFTKLWCKLKECLLHSFMLVQLSYYSPENLHIFLSTGANRKHSGYYISLLMLVRSYQKEMIGLETNRT